MPMPWMRTETDSEVQAAETKIEKARQRRAAYQAAYFANPCPKDYTVSYYSRSCVKVAGHPGAHGPAPRWADGAV